MTKQVLLEKASALKSSGMSLSQIAEELGISKSSVHRLLNENQVLERNETPVPEIEETVETPVKTGNGTRPTYRSSTGENPKLMYSLKKLELEHQRQMKQMELDEREREREFELEKASYYSKIQKLEEENERLKHYQIYEERNVPEEENDDEVIAEEPEIELIELPTKLRNEVSQIVSEIIELQGEELDKNEVAECIENLEFVLKRISKWCKSNGFDKTEISVWKPLMQLRKQFLEMQTELKNRSIFADKFIELELPDELLEELEVLIE